MSMSKEPYSRRFNRSRLRLAVLEALEASGTALTASDVMGIIGLSDDLQVRKTLAELAAEGVIRSRRARVERVFDGGRRRIQVSAMVYECMNAKRDGENSR